MKYMWGKKTIIGTLTILAAILIGMFGFYEAAGSPAPSATVGMVQKNIQINGKSIRVDVVDTEGARERGLGGRDLLAPDQGMLFVFPEDGMYTFWMKDMRFAIDIIWIAQNGTIVYIAPRVGPETYPHTFTPTQSARHVLEVVAGYVEANDVKVGDLVILH